MKKSKAKHRVSLRNGSCLKWAGVNCEENYFPILEQIIPSMTKQI